MGHAVNCSAANYLTRVARCNPISIPEISRAPTATILAALSHLPAGHLTNIGRQKSITERPPMLARRSHLDNPHALANKDRLGKTLYRQLISVPVQRWRAIEELHRSKSLG